MYIIISTGHQGCLKISRQEDQCCTSKFIFSFLPQCGSDEQKAAFHSFAGRLFIDTIGELRGFNLKTFSGGEESPFNHIWSFLSFRDNKLPRCWKMAWKCFYIIHSVSININNRVDQNIGIQFICTKSIINWPAWLKPRIKLHGNINIESPQIVPEATPFLFNFIISSLISWWYTQ